MGVQIGFIGGAYFDAEDAYEHITPRLIGGQMFEVTLANGRYGRAGENMVMLVNPAAVAYVQNHDPVRH